MLPAQIVMTALDEIALALAEYHHVWTDRQRALYERALAYLNRKEIGLLA